MALTVAAVPVLQDNYAWLVHDADGGATAVIDPGEAEPVLAAAAARGWRIGQVWITHWHHDHTGGLRGVKAATGADATGPAAEADRIAGLDRLVGEGDTVRLGAAEGRVLATPGHTGGHVSYLFDGLLFPGDTLFAMGCGRLFEGTPVEMWANLQRFAALPAGTLAYGAHEYTLDNARFALTVEPDNAALVERAAAVAAERAAGRPTLPTSIGLERATNPFMRAVDAGQLGERRRAKDAFR